MDLPVLTVSAVKIPVADLTASRRWYAEVFGLQETMEWPDTDGVVRGVALAGLGDMLLALRESPEAVGNPRSLGLNVRVPDESDLPTCVAHLEALGIRHTAVVNAANGRLVGFRDLDGHELSFYAMTIADGVRSDALRPVRAVQQSETAGSPA